MKRVYILYILFLILLFISALIVWPNRWINVDIGNFHYHKMWEGPDLSDLTFGKAEGDFNLDLGMDFRGGREYKLNVIFAEVSEDHAQKVVEAVKILRSRLQKAGFVESTVTFRKEGEEYYIYAKVPKGNNDFESSQILIQKGVLELWGEKGEEGISQEDTSADSETSLGQEVDPLRQYLEQYYTKLDIDLSEFKGSKVGKGEEDTYFIGLGLRKEQSKQLANQLYKFWGKSIIASLDGAFLPIEGSDLGEQMSLYGEVKNIKIAGFGDKDSANQNVAVIENGILPVDLVIAESFDQDPILGEDFLGKGLVGGGIVVVVTMMILFALFKGDGLVGTLSLIIFLLFFIAGIKVFHVRLAIGSILAFILVVSSYIALLFFSLLRGVKKAMIASGSLAKFLRSKDIVEFNNNFLLTQFILALVLFLFTPLSSKYFALALLLGIIFEYLVLDQLFPFCYKVINLWYRTSRVPLR